MLYVVSFKLIKFKQQNQINMVTKTLSKKKQFEN